MHLYLCVFRCLYITVPVNSVYWHVCVRVMFVCLPEAGWGAVRAVERPLQSAVFYGGRGVSLLSGSLQQGVGARRPGITPQKSPCDYKFVEPVPKRMV